MDLELEKTSLKELAVNYPELIPFFDKYNLDYSLHGELQLETACLNLGVYTKNLERELIAITSSSKKKNFPHIEKWSIKEIITLIKRQFHSYFISTTPLLSIYFELVSARLEKDYPNLKKIKGLFSWIEDEIDYHIYQERQILFPALYNLINNQELPEKSLKFLTEKMNLEAEELSYGFNEIKNLISQNLHSGSQMDIMRRMNKRFREFERNTHYYLHVENNILFPKALELENNYLQNKLPI